MAAAAPHILRTDQAFVSHEVPSLIPLCTSQPDITIITPRSPLYHDIHYEENECNTTVPLSIALPATLDELRSVVGYCMSTTPRIAMTVRGGGHDPYGRNTLAGALQLDLRLLKWIRVLPSASSADRTKVVAIGPGVTALEMQRALDAEGLSAPTGWVGSVGVTGWASGGGYGLSGGKWGLGVDNIVGARLLAPDGQFIDTEDDPELLWAVRGAGLGNFGVICELRLKAYPKPRYLAGIMTFGWSQAVQVLSGFQRLRDEGMPDNFSGEMAASTTEATGPVISILFSWICSTAAENDALAGWAYHDTLLKILGTPLVDSVSESKYYFISSSFSRANPSQQAKYVIT